VNAPSCSGLLRVAPGSLEGCSGGLRPKLVLYRHTHGPAQLSGEDKNTARDTTAN
jgi:hypothetical protein